MKRLTHGFTIVELLVVIVVIGILASVSIVLYNGAQGRARDAARTSDVKNIMDALEVYRSEKATYPPNSATVTTTPSSCSKQSGYSYSTASDGTWLKNLVTDRYIDRAPIPPINDCTHFYSYVHSSSATQYGCTYGVGFYILQVKGAEGNIPSQAVKTAPSGCSSWPSDLISTASNWTFIGFDDGLNH